jgi:hypothetical protein
MAKKQSRRSVSISKATYERLRAYCETNDVAMSAFVESRIGDFLGRPRTKTAKPAEDGREGEKRGTPDRADRIFTF